MKTNTFKFLKLSINILFAILILTIFHGCNLNSKGNSDKNQVTSTSDVLILSAPSISGMVGVGTSTTQAEYKDFKVTKNGEILYESNFSNGMEGWMPIKGQWQVYDGVLRQSSNEKDTRILIGNPNWTDYTISLKARKITGNEGFIILFGIPEADVHTRSWWNIGGWENNESALDSPEIRSPHVPKHIEDNLWYDIRIELNGPTVRAYLNNTLVHSVVKPADVPPFNVRPGYRVDLMSKNIGEVRFIEFGPSGDLYVSQPSTGAIITLRESDGRWNKVADFVTEKPTVHGMHFFDGWLWFAQSGAIWKARDVDGDGKADEIIEVLSDLPEGGGHWWRSILVTTDGFYTSIGDSGNINDLRDSDREKIWHYNLDGTGKKLFASGIRNTEKLRIRPGTNEVYGADHGSDNYGSLLGEERNNHPFTDKLPPDEFNHYVADGFYGHPFIVGNHLPRLEFKDSPDFLDLSKKAIDPAWCLEAHWAPNGWNFIKLDALKMKGDVVIACHGSWNSSVKVGYRLERLIFDSITGEIMGSQRLVSTITKNQDVLARPCDIAEAPDGSIFFSDDYTRRIYRLSIGEMPKTMISSDVSIPLPEAMITNPFRPLELFQSRCAVCHGSYGLGFGQQFIEKFSNDSLRIKLNQMMAGPAQVQLNKNQTDGMITYIKSIRDGKPYGYIVEANSNGMIYGEATPGSTIILQISNKTQSIPLDGHRWEVMLPNGFSKSDIHISISKNDKEFILDDIF